LKRIDALKQEVFEKGEFDGCLVFNSANQTWLTGFSCSSAVLIPKNGETKVYVYSVNYAHAMAELDQFTVEMVEHNEKLTEKIARQTEALGIKRLAVDTLNIEEWRALTNALGAGKTLEVNNRYLQKLRKVKDENEIKLMRKAAELTSEGMRVASEMVAAGVKENEVAAEIEYAMRRHGSSGTAFETIVASGVCSAYPHGGCSDKEIREGDLVVVDVGATFKFYRSDMSRTFVTGKPSEKQKKLYEVVMTAQEKGFEAVKPNVKAKDVDAAARKVIADAGYGEYFVHSLGHGVGLEVHEPPTLSPDCKDVLAAGNVVTVEPGVYLVGFGGIRIEDTVLVQKKGAEKLTNGPYALVEG
jgi:Xaa-Pro aminopeptidase